MNSAKDLLNELMLQDQIETELRRQIDGTKDEVTGRKAMVKKEWEDFVSEFFPAEILKAIDKYCYRRIWVGCLNIEISGSTITFRYVENGASKMMATINDGVCTSCIFSDNHSSIDYIAKELELKHRLLNITKENITKIYEQIADKRRVMVNETKKRLETIANTKIEEPQKRYRVTIETIEI